MEELRYPTFTRPDAHIFDKVYPAWACAGACWIKRNVRTSAKRDELFFKDMAILFGKLDSSNTNRP